MIDASDKIPSTTGKRYPFFGQITAQECDLATLGHCKQCPALVGYGPTSFYSIITREDGLVDVMLDPNPAHTPAGDRRRVVFMRGIEPHENLETQVRANYYAWCDAGEEAWI